MTTANHREIINQWLEALNQETEQDFQLDDDGVCVIQYGTDLACVLEVPELFEDAFFLHAALRELPPENAEQVLYQAMTLNLFQSETRGGTLGLDAENGLIILGLAQPFQHTDESGFLGILWSFLETADNLRDQLNTSDHEMGDESQTGVAEAGFSQMIRA